MLIKVTNGTAEPYSFRQLRLDNPNVSFPKVPSEDALNAYSVFTVTEEAPPAYNEATQKLVRNDPALNGSSWVITYSVVAKTAEEQQAYADAVMDDYKREVQRLLDSTAKERGYDSIISLCSYAGSTNTSWQAEANVATKWRDDCWNEALVQLGNYIATGVAPSMEDFLAAMPVPVWPE